MLADAWIRIAQDFAVELRALDWRGRQARLAACASLGAVGAVLLALALHLDNPWWAGISAISIVQADRRQPWRAPPSAGLAQSSARVIGLLLAPLVVWHLPFTIACAAVASFTVYAQERTTHSYAVLLGGRHRAAGFVRHAASTRAGAAFGRLSQPGGDGRHRGRRHSSVKYCILTPLLQLPPSTSLVFSRAPSIESCSAIALTGGFAVAAIPIIWTTFDLPSLGQTPITAFVVVTAMRADPYLKAVARLVGCCLGGLYGLLAVGLVGDAWSLARLSGARDLYRLLPAARQW